MSWRSAAAWVVVFAVLTVLAALVVQEPVDDTPVLDASAPPPAAAATAGRKVRVLRVVDGDTIVVRSNRGRERVRYIGVDAPESVKPDSPVECFGKEASRFNRRLVAGRTAELVSDREPRDRFGRTLAFVWVGDTLVNAELLRRGYARTLEIAPNTSQAGYFAELQSVAKRTKIGLWQACSG